MSIGSAFCDEPLPPLKSGPEIGSEVTSFYVRAVTGPHAGKSVCYVCRNGDRPVVMVVVRELGPDVTRLLKQLDQCVNENRGNGLRCFVVMLSNSSQKDGARLQTLAFDEKIELPLTVASEAIAGTNLDAIPKTAAVSVILYDDLTVKERFAYRTGECNPSACQTILAAAKNLVKNSAQ